MYAIFYVVGHVPVVLLYVSSSIRRRRRRRQSGDNRHLLRHRRDHYVLSLSRVPIKPTTDGPLIFVSYIYTRENVLRGGGGGRSKNIYFARNYNGRADEGAR